MFLHLSVILFTGVGLCPGVSVQEEGSLSGGVSVRENPRKVTCRRYSFYWNAFLLTSFSSMWSFYPSLLPVSVHNAFVAKMMS